MNYGALACLIVFLLIVAFFIWAIITANKEFKKE